MPDSLQHNCGKTTHTFKIPSDVLRPIILGNIVGFRGFDSSIILNLMGGIPMSIGDFPESLSQAMLVGMMLVGRLGVLAASGVAPACANARSNMSHNNDDNNDNSDDNSNTCLLLIIYIILYIYDDFHV